MSSYVIRMVEGYLPVIKGGYYDVSEIPADRKDGEVYHIYCNKGENKYYRIARNEPVEIEKPPMAWQPLDLYSKLPYTPLRSYYLDDDGTRKFYEKPSPFIHTFKDAEGNDVVFRSKQCTSRQGVLRDDIISTAFNNTPITDRGWPQDISPDMKKRLYTTNYNGDLVLAGSAYTYATLTDLTTFQSQLRAEVIAKYTKDAKDESMEDINKKLDFLIRHMKNPIESDEDYKKTFIDAKEDEDDYDDWYDEEEENQKLYEYEAISEEIGILQIYKSLFDIYSSNEIRFIYYIEH